MGIDSSSLPPPPPLFNVPSQQPQQRNQLSCWSIVVPSLKRAAHPLFVPCPSPQPFKPFQVRTILAHLPKDREGRIRVNDFLFTDVHSRDVFQVFDKNKDGYITKGELKVMKKNFSIKDIDNTIKVN